MLFVKMHPLNWRLEDAKNIAQRILDYGTANHCLSDKQTQELCAIIKPSLNVDTQEMKRLWQDLVDTLVITTPKGQVFKFVVDPQNHTLYFGDEAGISEARLFEENPRDLHK